MVGVIESVVLLLHNPHARPTHGRQSRTRGLEILRLLDQMLILDVFRSRMRCSLITRGYPLVIIFSDISDHENN